MRCVSERIGPLLIEVGEVWARGELSGYQEHFASEQLRDFLISRWRPLSTTREGGSCVVCATLPGELHTLGQHMAAVVLALSSSPLLFLGADSPLDDIARAAHATATVAVAVSVSRSARAEEVEAQLEALREAVDPAIGRAAGGCGAAGSVEGVMRLATRVDLAEWVASLPR